MGRRWTASDVNKLPAGMVKGMTVPKPVEPLPSNHGGYAKSARVQEKADLGLTIYAICKNGGFELKEEYRFHAKRRYKFDWALPALKIAIEYEGLKSKKSGHTTMTGYTENCTKYNLALLEGWHLLRYTLLNYKNAGSDLLALINKTIADSDRQRV